MCIRPQGSKRPSHTQSGREMLMCISRGASPPRKSASRLSALSSSLVSILSRSIHLFAGSLASQPSSSYRIPRRISLCEIARTMHHGVVLCSRRRIPRAYHHTAEKESTPPHMHARRGPGWFFLAFPVASYTAAVSRRFMLRRSWQISPSARRSRTSGRRPPCAAPPSPPPWSDSDPAASPPASSAAPAPCPAPHSPPPTAPPSP